MILILHNCSKWNQTELDVNNLIIKWCLFASLSAVSEGTSDGSVSWGTAGLRGDIACLNTYTFTDL